ncbi:hypothetical protein OSG_eHP29_00070 [environmental Halophage eHP-29]|nr:hypothetical protein OSG_eHP29_00070 [environmental Halophage eHP-29]
MTNQIYTGDCFEQLPALDENSVHAIVTDPPYGLAFMGRSWDDFEPKEYQEWCEKWATECLRVLKPGGHLLAFSGNRTHHRLMSGIEDAGYEIRDTITWHYGSGFPKALDVSKSIDKQAGKKEDREVTGKYHNPDGTTRDYDGYDTSCNVYCDRIDSNEHRQTTEPATEQAEQWDGFKSALKPATEFVCVARSPLAEDTIAENVVTHGTGALNIDATRVESEDGGWTRKGPIPDISGGSYAGGNAENGALGPSDMTQECDDNGRYPANVVFDAQQADVLDDEVGELGGGSMTRNGDVEGKEWENDVNEGYTEGRDRSMFVNEAADDGVRSYGDSGGPSRYFYTSKASKAERTLDGKIDNAHPTVKPIDLMEWLVQLATAEEQIVLDPFAGSGTTCKAAKNKNRQFIGIEQQAKWADVARVRSGLPPDDHSHIRSDDEQHGLEQF